MTPKGFGYTDKEVLDDIHIPSEYIAHPKNMDDLMSLKREIERLERPGFKTCKYLHTTIVNVNDLKLRKNVGRKRGNDTDVLDRVGRSLEKGYKRGKLPPVVLFDEENNCHYDWLVNGNHRWLWYIHNNFEWMLVDVYTTNKGYDEGDVIDEVGLLHQPKPDGTEPSYQDYKQRGQDYVKRQQDKNITVTQKMVDDWVDTFACDESSITRVNLKRNIFKEELEDSDLVNYMNKRNSKSSHKKGGLLYEFEKYGITIYNSDHTVPDNIKTVDRLYEASQPVWLRDFCIPFMKSFHQNKKTRVNYYINTRNVTDGNELLKNIRDSLSLLEEFISSQQLVVDKVLQDVGYEGELPYSIRDYILKGFRPYQVDKVDTPNNLQKLTSDLPNKSSILNKGLYKLTKKLLEDGFGKECFTAEQAYEQVREYRMTISTFKSEKSFRGTILRELQILRDDGILKFVKNGLYCFI